MSGIHNTLGNQAAESHGILWQTVANAAALAALTVDAAAVAQRKVVLQTDTGQLWIPTATTPTFAPLIALDQTGAPSGPVDFNSKKQTHVANGVLDTDGSNFGQLNDVSAKKTCTASTTAALAGTWNYSNGTLGVGATLTRTTNGALPAQDSQTLAAGLTLFVRFEAAPERNGRYDITVLGDASNPTMLTRATDADTAQKLRGSVIGVAKGTLYSGTLWVLPLKSSDITVGTTALTWINSAIQGLASAQAAVSVNGQQITNARRATIADGDVMTRASGNGPFGVRFFEDWLNGDATGQNKWTNVVAGTGTVTAVVTGGSAKRPGVLRLSRGTTAVSRAGTFLGTTGGSWVLGTDGNWYLYFGFNISTLSDGTNTFRFVIGLGDTSAAGDQVNGLFVVVDSTVSSALSLEARASSVGAPVAGTFAVTGATWVDCRVKKADGGTVFGLEWLNPATHAWVDQGISISTNIPTGNLDLFAKLDGTVGTANRTVDIDYVGVDIEFPLGRT